jgi:hypothetical protein
VSLTTPTSVRKLQRALYAKAKANPTYRFYALYDKIYRKEVLLWAWSCCRANGGSCGVDGQSFAGIEAKGVEAWLDQLAKALKEKTYRPQAVGRVLIPKPDGKQRPLGIATDYSDCTCAQFLFGLGAYHPSISSTLRTAFPHSQDPEDRRRGCLESLRRDKRQSADSPGLDRSSPTSPLRRTD